MHIEEKYNGKRIMIEIAGTIIGSFIMAIGISLFLLPNQLSSGGLAGIATIAYYLLYIPMGTTILILNIPLFAIAAYKLGKSFLIKSIIGTITLSYFIDILDKLEPLTNDRFLACVYGGILIGFGTAILLKVDSSTGGSDLISYVAKEYNPMLRVGNIIIIIDIVIVTLNILFLKEIEIGLYSAIAIYIMGKMIDILFEGIYFTKLILIISHKNEEIAKEIGKNIQRGTTRITRQRNVYTRKEISINVCSI